MLKIWWTRVFPGLPDGTHFLDFQIAGWDAGELRLLQRLSPGIRHFADIGAHHGLYSVAVGKFTDNRALVDAFEPFENARKRSLLHLKLNGIRNFQLHAMAVGEVDQAVNFVIPDRETQTTGHVSDKVEGDDKAVVTLAQVSLESFYPSDALKHPDMIKLDIEGKELEALKGAGNIVGNGKTAWIFEVLDHHLSHGLVSARPVIEFFLNDPRYRVFHIQEDGTLCDPVLREGYPHTHLCNYLAVPITRTDFLDLLNAV